MPESAEPQNDISLEASVPEGTGPAGVDRLYGGTASPDEKRPPDFEKENRALVALATSP